MDKVAQERHIKQNKEIIRINQIQSGRIAALETEISKLLSENIQLRAQVIQLNHRHDVSTQKAQLEKKLREIHRIVKSLGTNINSAQSPQIIKKSPKKTNLLNVSPDHSPDRSASDFINARSRTRSLFGAPGRVATAMQDVASPREVPNEETELEASDTLATEREAHVSRQHKILDRERDRAREARRSSGRVSGMDDGQGLLMDKIEAADHTGVESPVIERRSSTEAVERMHERSSRRKSRTLLLSEPETNPSRSERGTRRKTLMEHTLADEDDKENSAVEKSSTAAIRLLHSSPKKNRTALNVIADPLPSINIQTVETPGKPLKGLIEVKSEPNSPAFLLNEPHQDDTADTSETGQDDQGGRSRRGKSVNYAEPSLRVKMRRTESLPGDKRRKSSYRRLSAAPPSDESKSSNSFPRQEITIDED